MKKITELGRKIGDLSKNELERAEQIHERSIVIDGLEPGLRLDPIAFERRKKGGLTAVHVTCPDIWAGPIQAYRQISEHRRFVDSHKDKALLVQTSDDVRNAKKEGKFSVILGSQNGNPLIEKVEDVAFLKWAGMRIIQITYNTKNSIGDGLAERTNCGLSQFGIDVVKEMNKQGIVVDLSHCGDRTTLDAIEFSNSPCIFSHANPRSVQDQLRNKTDEAIHALAEKGGVIAVCSYPPILRIGDNPPKIEDVYAHVKYVEDLVGIDHVGLSTDINEKNQESEQIVRPRSPPPDWLRMPPPEITAKWPIRLPGGFNGEGFQDITKVLVAGGYSDREIEKTLGGNLLRIFEEVWK